MMMAKIIEKSQTGHEDLDVATSRSCKKPKTNGDDDDSISKLPDEILAHILSYIPTTRFAVSTSILSKRWKLVWTSVPILEFDCLDSERFVRRVLSLNHVRPLRSVKLSSYYAPSVTHADELFEALVAYEPEAFHLHLPYLSNVHSLPRSFYHQRNLVELRLSNVVLKQPPSVCFPRLRTMKLILVRFLGDDSMKKLMSGCPSLAELHIEQQKGVDILKRRDIYIGSSTLQALYIYKKGCDWKNVINAPKLRYLDLKGSSETYHMIDVSLLVKACVSTSQRVDSTLGLLRQISHVQELYLDRLIMKVFASISLRHLSVFHNLIHLTVEVDCRESLSLLPRMLYYTPNVVHIVLKLKDEYAKLHSKENPLDLLHSILSWILSVEIIEHIGQLPVVSCSLENATTTLEKLYIHGLPLHFARDNRFLKSVMTGCQTKCECEMCNKDSFE